MNLFNYIKRKIRDCRGRKSGEHAEIANQISEEEEFDENESVGIDGRINASGFEPPII